MPPKALKQILFKIEGTADFLGKIDPDYKKLCGKFTRLNNFLFITTDAIVTMNNLLMIYVAWSSYRSTFELVRTLRLH